LADLSEVEAALVSAAIAAIYPNGTSGTSAVGAPVRIYRGWPVTGPLSLDLAQGVANISVFPLPGGTQNTTRWQPIQVAQQRPKTLFANGSGISITFSGDAAAGQLAGILADNQPYVYRTQAGDTPAVVAASLVQMIGDVRACWLSGTSLTVPGAIRLIGRVTIDGITTTEWSRQVQAFRISLWCPNPLLRDQLASLLGSSFAALSFLTLNDGTSGRLRFRSTACFDDDQDAQQYRRDLIYEVEYGTTLAMTTPAMLFGDIVWAGSLTYA
jgi:hypothetical protein